MTDNETNVETIEPVSNPARKGWRGHVPPKDKWHIYKDGSPGFARKTNRLTLTQIQKEIKASKSQTKARKKYRDDGLIGISI